MEHKFKVVLEVKVTDEDIKRARESDLLPHTDKIQPGDYRQYVNGELAFWLDSPFTGMQVETVTELDNAAWEDRNGAQVRWSEDQDFYLVNYRVLVADAMNWESDGSSLWYEVADTAEYLANVLADEHNVDHSSLEWQTPDGVQLVGDYFVVELSAEKVADNPEPGFDPEQSLSDQYEVSHHLDTED